MTEQATDKIRIAFVEVTVFDDGSVRGGVLVTDRLSRPYEFRVTSPIKPTQLQKILYGKSLVEYMYGELICVPLLKQVKEQVSIAICQDEHLLVARTSLQIPLVALKKPSQGPEKNGEDVITIRTHKNFTGEQAQSEILVNGFIQQFNIFEPFERVRLAVSEVHKQKVN